ncbi:MAG: helix-turn-helix transcriptional regulator [Liquorilactobacillus nagelii]|uniref:helix-turn-helix domain-containing protein n=1 Tax=Liquorilactobacillus nagelii TaxID=82688 RepID=UPI0039EC725D
MANTNLSKIIKSTRIKLKMSQETFGKEFNPPAAKSIVSRWERGDSIPNPERLLKISDLSGYSVEELLYGTLKNTIIDLAKNAQKRMHTFFKDRYPHPDEFINQSQDTHERMFLGDIFNFVTFMEQSYFGTPRPESLWKSRENRTELEQRQIDDYYHKEYNAGMNKVCHRVYNICKKTGVKPYQKNLIMNLLAKEAELIFSDIDRNNEGLVNFAVEELENLYARKIPDFVYGENSNGDAIKLSPSISTELEHKIENMIENLSNDIYDLVQHEK